LLIRFDVISREQDDGQDEWGFSGFMDVDVQMSRCAGSQDEMP